MKKIGLVDYYISEWHANHYPAWIKELDRGYEVAYAWAEEEVSPVDGVTTGEWCEKMGITRCATLQELCTVCDNVIILAPSNPEKHYEYAKAVLPFGKPTYIDKTFAPDLKTAKAMFGLGGAPFFSTSALRYAAELREFAEAQNLTLTGGGRSFEEYSVHLVEMAVVLLRQPVKSVEVKTVGGHKFCFITGQKGRTVNLVYAPGMGYSVSALQEGKERQLAVNSDFFKALMAEILNFFESGKPPVAECETLEVMALRDRLMEAEA